MTKTITECRSPDLILLGLLIHFEQTTYTTMYNAIDMKPLVDYSPKMPVYCNIRYKRV